MTHSSSTTQASRDARPDDAATVLVGELYREFPRRAPRVVEPPKVILTDPARLRAVREANLRRLFSDGQALDDLVEELWDEARYGGVIGALQRTRALLEELASSDFGGHCPHGRPIVTRLPFTELERRVGRR